jgi:hypothetical protein
MILPGGGSRKCPDEFNQLRIGRGRGGALRLALCFRFCLGARRPVHSLPHVAKPASRAVSFKVGAQFSRVLVANWSE